MNSSGRMCYINSVDKKIMKQKSKAVEECVTSTVSTKFWWNRNQRQWKNVLHQQCRQNFDETEIKGSGRMCYINSVDKILMKQKSKAVEEHVTSIVLTKFWWKSEIKGSGRTCYINSVDKILMKQKSKAVEECVTSTVLTKFWWNRNQRQWKNMLHQQCWKKIDETNQQQWKNVVHQQHQFCFLWNRNQRQWKNVLHQQCRQNQDKTENTAVEECVTSTMSTKSG